VAPPQARRAAHVSGLFLPHVGKSRARGWSGRSQCEVATMSGRNSPLTWAARRACGGILLAADYAVTTLTDLQPLASEVVT